MACCGALIGHSFVSGLSDHLSHAGCRLAPPSLIAQRLSISDRVSAFHLVGARGASVKPNGAASALVATLDVLRPTFVVIDIGGNDLSRCISPLNIAVAILDMAHDILSNTANNGIRHVTVCSLLYRTRNTGTTTVDEYNALVNHTNTIMRHMCDVENNIKYHTHKGFWNNPHAVWSRDGTNPNTTVGRKNYIRSLRNASNFAFSALKQR